MITVIILSLFILDVSSLDTVKIVPIRAVTELDIGESQDVILGNGEVVKLELLEINEVRDSLRDAIREAYVKVSVDSEEIVLSAGTYNIPVVIGNVQIDCPAIKGYYTNSNKDRWGLSKDARFRLWPKGSPYLLPGTFVCPLKQDWLASMSQSANEPTYVDWGESPANKTIYYHSGHDMGGAEGMDEIVSATDGLVISARNEILDGYDDIPGDSREDVVYVVDKRGWYIRYSHLNSVDPAIKPGMKVKIGHYIVKVERSNEHGYKATAHLHVEVNYQPKKAY